MRRTIIVTCALALATLLVINKTFFFKSGILERINALLVYPVLIITHSLSNYSTTIITHRQSYESLKQKYTALKKDYETLQQELITIKATERHHELSDSLRNFQKRYDLHDAQFATILIKNITENEHSFITNKGSFHGIKPNMIAIYKLQIIGKVIEVFDFYSKIILVTDQTCKVSAFTNTTNALGIVTGTNKINHCKLLYVTNLSTINVNDLIFSSGQGMTFPEGFCLGKVTKSTFNQGDMHYSIDLEPLVDLQSLQCCLLTDRTKIDLV